MDKYEYRVRAEEINALIDKKEYAEAVKIADTIDWRRVKSVMMLCKVSDLYKMNRRYEDSKEILLLAYDRHPGGRKIIYSLCELSIKLEEIVQAVEYYKEFVQVAPRDTGRFILQYRLYEVQDVSLEERIAVLEEYKKRDYREKWAYELAYLYHRIGLATRCVEECDELILWFGDGRYVIKAMELKMLHEPLSPSQQEKYDRRFAKIAARKEAQRVEQEQNDAELAKTLPISIKAVEVTNAPTAKIPSKKVQEELDEADSANDTDDGMMSEDEMDEAEEIAQTQSISLSALEAAAAEKADAQEAEETQEESNQEVPQQTEKGVDIEHADPVKPADDLDIQIKPIDMGEYNTINLQQELAKNLAKMLAEEDMEATDATRALPIETILDSTDPNLMKGITGDAVKNAIIAPLLQDTTELTPITEEDLLASLEEKPKTIEEIKQAEEDATKKAIELAAAATQPIETQEIAAAKPVETAAPIEPTAESAPVEATAEPAPVEATAEPAPTVESASAEPTAESAPTEPTAEPTLAEPTVVAAPIITAAPTAKLPEAAEIAAAAEAIADARRVATGVTGAIRATVQNMDAVLGSSMTGVSHTIEPEPTSETGSTSETEIKQTAETAQATEEEMLDEQITGQLSFTDIMAEWEETKKANEEKHREEMRQRLLKQTGPMFADFDAAARASIASDLNMISPMVDVFHDTDDLATEVEAALEADSREEASKDAAKKQTSSLFEQVEDAVTAEDEVEELAEIEEEPVNTKVFNTAEIRGIEEKLLHNLQQESEQIEPELVVPVIPVTAPLPEITPETVQSAAEAASEMQPGESPAVEAPAAEALVTEAAVAETPVAEAPVTEVPVAEAPVTEAAAEEAPAVEAPVSEPEMAETPAETPQKEAEETVSEGRILNKQERELFGAFAQTKQVERQVAYAIDHISMTGFTGNVLITGAKGTGTINIAKNLIKIVQATNSNFSNKVAKITGSLLDKKDIKATLSSLENGALIVEKAGDLTDHVCEKIVNYLNGLSEERGILILFEDTKGSIDRLVGAYPQMINTFNIRIDVEALDNDGLVNYGKEYAKEQEYTIDDMGVLALYTRIADMQTNDHHVTVEEVKEIVDEAIANASKKSVSHFMDVIFAKRYDAEDMIVLREKDFLKDR